ncbi:MAG: complex I NDUFA9 subunit family protein, partial [Alphaproteobacteria bacterium]
IVSIFGGTGFIGRNLVRQLVKEGYRIKVATRSPNLANSIRVSGNIGQVETSRVNIFDEQSISDFIKGSNYVINLIGILNETRKYKFNYIHAGLPKKIARLSREMDVERFIHISALGSEIGSKSRYLNSKAQGEKDIFSENSNSTVIKPSLVFGYDDNFFNQFASILSLVPIFPLIGLGNTKFQPVYVADLAKLIVSHLKDDNKKDVYEIGGNEIYSLKQILEFIVKITKKKRLLVPIPFSISKLFITPLQIMPKPLITYDQIESLKKDNILLKTKSNKIGNLGDYEIHPVSIKNIVPNYLKRFSN